MTIAAFPMYDWPEARASVDAQWCELRARLADAGIDAPRELIRRNADLPPVAGGIRDASGTEIAPDPASLTPGGLDLQALWKHPDLLLSQTCWGPMENGLEKHVLVVGQPRYDDVEGGRGVLYSSAILMRRSVRNAVAAPADGRAMLPLDLLRGSSFAYNGTDSMSGLIALMRDLEAMGEGPAIFSSLLETGSHRASVIAVAEGRADACAVDSRSWQLARTWEPRSREVEVVGWTALRKGLPFITSKLTPPETVERLRSVLLAE